MGAMTFEELEKSLKPCPFCGRPARIAYTESSHLGVLMVIGCTGCGATIDHWQTSYVPYPDSFDSMTSIQLWNMRDGFFDTVAPYEAHGQVYTVSVDRNHGNAIPYETRALVYQEALELYGQQTQVAVAVEEMSELTKALIKVYRGGGDLTAVAEELADVTIMLEQLRLIFDCNDQVCRIMDEKVQHLQARIEADRQH